MTVRCVIVIIMLCYNRQLFAVVPICRFVLGRERDSSHSEVARLIQMSIEQDRRRAEQRRMELEQRQHQLELQQRVYEYQLQQQQHLKQQGTSSATQHGLPSVDDQVHSEFEVGIVLSRLNVLVPSLQ